MLVVVVWGVGGAAAMEIACLTGREREVVVADAVLATEAAMFFFVAGWSSVAVDASAAFRFLVRGGMVAVFGWETDF